MFLSPVDCQTIFQELNNQNFSAAVGSGQNPFNAFTFGRANIPRQQSQFPNCEFSDFEYSSKPKVISSIIKITLFEAYKGCQYPLSIVRWCIENNKQIEQNETIYVTVPKGIDNNEIITLKDKGNRISNTNKGDIEIKINIINNTAFERNGIDLILKKSITLKESFCGFSFELQYLDGREFKINNETGNIIPQDFRKIIPKLGMQRDNIYGNLIIIFNIIYPKQFTASQINTLKEIL